MVSKQVCAEAELVLPEDVPDLGPLEEVHSDAWNASPPLNLVAGLLCLPLAAVFLAGLLFLPVERDQVIAKNIALGLAAAAVGSLGLVAIAFAVRGWGRRFQFGKHWLVFEDALVTVHSGEVGVYHWDELEVWFEFVRPGLYFGGDKRYRLRSRRTIPLPKLDRHARKLLAAVQDRQAAALRPRAVKRLAAGKVVEFGPIRLTEGGITYAGTTYPWDEVRKLDFEYNIPEASIEMVIGTRERSKRRVPLSAEVPNIWVMYNVIRAVRPKVVKDQTKAKSYLR